MISFLQISGNVHKNGNIAGNGNTGSISPRNQGDLTNRKRLSDQSTDTYGKKRRATDNEQAVAHVGTENKILIIIN